MDKQAKKINNKITLLFLSLTGFIAPCINLVYLPVLSTLAEDFNTTIPIITLGITLTLFPAGIGLFVGGSTSDFIGRKRVLIACFLIFNLATLGCIFTKDITIFLILRVAHAFVIRAALPTAFASLIDISNSSNRGKYLSVIIFALLSGVVIGPFLGGIISEMFGWRGIFVFLLIYGSIVNISYIFLKETNQNLKKVTFGKLIFSWIRPFKFLKNKICSVLVICQGISFASLMFIMICIPLIGKNVYNLTDSQIGLLYLPSGVGGLISSFLSGRIIDYFYTKKYQTLGSRLIIPVVGYMCFSVLLIAIGYTIKQNLILFMVQCFVFDFFYTSSMNGLQAFLFGLIPNETSSLSALLSLSESVFGFFSTQYGSMINHENLHLSYFGFFSLCIICALCLIIILRKYWNIKENDHNQHGKNDNTGVDGNRKQDNMENECTEIGDTRDILELKNIEQRTEKDSSKKSKQSQENQPIFNQNNLENEFN
ncbi:quinidine resistance protein [Anaeramoeba flamelloides]|uniref:Quinidine resistance protein n=1 Tax=Anaeramoeba flamelloides TaxID=1746091 RepID=A0ABQ8YI86_9EUKA|nr:quinidine resistance protein [Anaeramoeba flamelloides]